MREPPGPADDQAPCSLCLGSRTRTRETQRGRPRSRIAHRVAGACGLVEADRPRDTEQGPPGPCAAPRGARPLPRLPKLPSRLPTVGLAVLVIVATGARRVE